MFSLRTPPFQADSTTRPYNIDSYFVVRSIGATGKIYGSMSISTDNEEAGFGTTTNIGELTVDTTGALAITATAKFDASNGNHFANIQIGSIEILKSA